MPAAITDNETVTVELSIKGKVSKLSTHVQEIRVEKRINKIARATISINDGDVAIQKFSLFEENSFKLGDDIIIKAGGNPKSLKQIYKGIIAGVSTQIIHKRSIVNIECLDKAIAMTKGRKTDVFLKKKDDVIIKELIAKTSGLTAKVDACTITHEKLVQYGISDWDFMLMRADANGLLVCNSDAEVAVKKPKLSAAATATYSYGKDVLAFESLTTGEFAIAKFAETHWDFKSGGVKTGKSSESSNLATPTALPFTKIKAFAKPADNTGITTSGIKNANQFKDVLNAKVIRTYLASQRGSITVPGDITPVLANIIEVKGLGKLAGKFFVSGIEHQIFEGQFITLLEFGMDEKTHFEKHPYIHNDSIASYVGFAHGLQLGEVTKLDGDPEGQQRIQVKLPVFGSDALFWARLTFPDAGKNRGIFFVPEKGDEVVVSFLDGDPAQPVILGTLYNKSNTSPAKITATNDKRIIQSKKKVIIEFDDTKKNLTLKTPGGNSILMDDAKGITIKDKNGNSIELGSAGITLKTMKEVSLKATKGIKLTADAGPIKIAGLQIDGQAKTTLKLAGKASAEVSASGIMTIKGALVKIN